MNGIARANATKRFVGKPGISVAGCRPPEFTASSPSGKIDRRDDIRRLPRLAHDRAAGEVVDLARDDAHRRAGSASLGLGGGALERPAGLLEEDVVERGRVELEVRGVQAPRRRAHGRSRRGRGRSCAQRTATLSGESWTSSPKRRRISASADRAARGRRATTSTVGRPISAFSAVGRALGDDLPVVDDPDPVGEDVGLLQVLRGQEDGHAVLLREPADLAARARSGSADRGRSSARRGRASAGGGRARARGRGGASSRPSTCARGGRRRGEADALEQLVPAPRALVAAGCRAARSGDACGRAR